jgi:hypothetical protein
VQTKCAELRQLLYDDSRDHDETMERLKSLSGITDCIVQGLEEKAAEGDWSGFGRYLWAAFSHPSRELTPVLVAALSRKDDNAPNEGMVDLLITIADPAAFDVLRQMLWWNPEWDDAHAIAVKAVYALGELPSTEAVIREAAEKGAEEVREVAARVLEYGVG